MVFTIDTDNNIAAFATAGEVAAGATATVETFATQKELTALAETWPAERVAAIWNSLPGVKEVKGFKSAKAGAARIWDRIQKLGDGAKTEPKRNAVKKPHKATRAKKPAKGKKATKTESAGPRQGSKAAQVVAMLQRDHGATLSEIMRKMG